MPAHTVSEPGLRARALSLVTCPSLKPNYFPRENLGWSKPSEATNAT